MDILSKSDAKKKREEFKAAYLRVFSSDAGKKVLADLSEQFYDCHFKDADQARQVGRRDVVMHIKEMMDKERG